MVADRSAFEQFVELGSPLDGEAEVVAEGDSLRREQIVGGHPFVVPAAEVQVLRRPEARTQTEVQRDRALEDPPVRRCDHETRQESLERDQLAQAHERNILLPGLREESLLQRGPKRGGRRVSHAGTLRSAPSMSAATRRLRSAAPCRSCSGAVSPRSTAWATASST